MTEQEILVETQRLAAILTERGFYASEVVASIPGIMEEDWVIRASARLEEDGFSNSIAENIFPDEGTGTLEEGFWMLETRLRNLKTPTELRQEKFLHRLGRLIDEGRELDLSVDFLNPLEETMKKLSTNILEK